MRKPTPSIQDLKQVLESTSPTSRLGRWLAANRTEFARSLAETRPNWEALVEWFAENDLLTLPAAWQDPDGSETRKQARRRTIEAAKQVWNRVKRRPEPSAHQPEPQPAPRRIRPKMVLENAVPLKQGEPATPDGSRLPQPIRPALHPSMDDVLGEWEARRPKMPKPI